MIYDGLKYDNEISVRVCFKVLKEYVPSILVMVKLYRQWDVYIFLL
jgi:hypothetical protein